MTRRYFSWKTTRTPDRSREFRAEAERRRYIENAQDRYSKLGPSSDPYDVEQRALRAERDDYGPDRKVCEVCWSVVPLTHICA